MPLGGAFINEKECLLCDVCLAAKTCPTKAIFRLDAGEPPIVEARFCFACGACVETCKGRAIHLE